MFEIIPKNLEIDFAGRRYYTIALSVVAVVATIVLFFTRGLNYGIDFTGGAEVQLKFSQPYKIGELRSLLTSKDFKNLSIQQLGEESLHEYLVKIGGEDETALQRVGARVEEALGTVMAREAFEILRLDVVGPQAGSELRKSGFLSMFYALLCILIYVAIRFDFRYSPGAVLALMHDSLITLGVFIVLQKEFSLQIVAAILTIIGYSNNDTIIVFDRIRENLKLHPNRTIEQTVNSSINETLSRTILTSLTTFLVTASLMIFGGGVIHEFAFTMCVGILVGTYSSIFVASAVLIEITKWQERKAGKRGAARSPGAVVREAAR
jgi:preprotein translocase subunit SecF